METNAQITGEELERRQATIKDLHVFVSDYKNWLDKSMTDLGFTKQHLLQKVDLAHFLKINIAFIPVYSFTTLTPSYAVLSRIVAPSLFVPPPYFSTEKYMICSELIFFSIKTT